jgi:hypothetical protein
MLLRLLTLLQKLSMEVLSPLLEALVFPLGLERATRPLPSLYFAAAGAVPGREAATASAAVAIAAPNLLSA